MDAVPATQALLSSEAEPRDRSRGVLVAVSLALFCIQVDFFALNLALPTMAREFGVGTDEVQWTISAYMLSLGSLFILAGRIGDVFGRRRALLAGIAAFGGASAACALAPSLGVLVACRVFQGAGAAVIFPVGISALSNEFSEQRRAWALGLAFAIANIGTALGPFVGGGLAGGPGWRWIFWALVPLSAVSLWVAVVTVRDSRDQSAPRRLDLPGTAVVVAGVSVVSIAADRGGSWGWGSALTIGAFVLAGVLLVVFVMLESRVRVPLVDLRLFRNLPFVLVSAMGAVSNIGYATTIFGATLYLQQVRGLAPLSAGALFLAPSALVALSGPIGARLGKHFRPAAVMAGAGVVSGSGLLALTFAYAWIAYVPAFALAGLGFGLGWTFVNIATQEVVRPERAGVASGVVLTIVVTAGGIGVAAAASAIALLESSGASTADAIDGTLRVIALMVLAAAALMMTVRHQLVRRGLIAPLSMSADWNPPSTSD